MKHHAYWIDRFGDIIPVSTRHILSVCTDPGRYGLAHESIAAIFARHGEPLGHEGKARQEIMEDLIVNHGWVRVRYSPRYDRWTMEMNRFDELMSLIIRKFFEVILETQTRQISMPAKIYSDVLIHELACREDPAAIRHMTIQQLFNK